MYFEFSQPSSPPPKKERPCLSEILALFLRMSVHFPVLGPNPSLIKCILLPDILKDFQVVSVLFYNL